MRAVYNLAENAQYLIDYINQSVLTEFQAFVRSGSQYKEDAAYIPARWMNSKIIPRT